MGNYTGTFIDNSRINDTLNKEALNDSDLIELFLFLTFNNKKLSQQSSALITSIMSNIKSSQLKRISSYFRYKTSMEWDFNWKDYAIRKLTRHIDNPKELVNIIGLASFHCNGYFREKALDELIKINDASTLPFILLRTNDYVNVIRSKATKALAEIVDEEHFTEIIKHYSLIDLSKNWKYSITELIEYKLDDISKKLPTETIINSIEQASPKGKVYSYKLLIENDDLPKSDICYLLLNEDEYYVKTMAFNNLIEQLNSNELIDYKDILFKIKSPNIRVKLIEKLYSIGYYTNQESLKFTLLDRYSRVRRTGLEYIKELGEFDIIDYYYDILDIHPYNVYAVCGLCEYGTKQDFEFLKTYLSSDSIQIVSNILSYISKIECKNFIDILIEYIEDIRIGISNKARRLLIANKHMVEVDLIYKIYMQNKVEHVKYNCMLFLVNLQKWDSIPFILEFVNSNDSFVSNFGNRFFLSWRGNFNKSFIKPSKNQIDNIKKVIGKTDKSSKDIQNKTEYLKFIIKDYQ